MTTSNILNEIETALAGITQGDFVDAGRRLLETLGYSSDRTLELSGTVDDFIAEFSAPNPNTQTETRFRERARSARILFQFTDSEIAAAQPSLLDSADFDSGNSRSFMFIAVELRGKSYPRGAYVELTREINKRLRVPTVVLFRTANDRFSVAFVHRRQRKRDPTRDVLGSVSLIREIDTSNPHRAHLDILRKLALSARLSWMNAHRELHNFDGLLAAWLEALDTEELNRSFYRQLFTWFERAIEEAKFPKNQTVTLSSEEHIIRLITRLLFVWFIKEKGLIAPELFIEAQIESLLRHYDRESGDSYYRAVLQNLFFATLNSEIKVRRFSTNSREDHREPSYYRFKEEIADPDRLLGLFGQTPFINGGLFDCLDSRKAPREGGYRIDCFSDNVIRPGSDDFEILSIPNRLFFDEKGLISLFSRFQFTVEENTPTEKEVALDPELLGKVFENLLAAYNPETRETARKQTGSYYTPRAVVDYMVDEALLASLAQNCTPADGDTEFWKERLSYLLDHEDAFDDAHELFEDVEKEGLVRAIAQIKLIDPAVGSGAFPMGALHKLTLALRRVDHDNRHWERLQKDLAGQRASAAFETPNRSERNAELERISATFDKYRDSDFGRKLYLIQNSIYGVDIQPIACQIARLRFFISLAIEQERNPDAENFGIKPLPNLETKFVAANTLIGLNLSTVEPLLQEEALQKLLRKIAENREKQFLPSGRRQKLTYLREENLLLEQLSEALDERRKAWHASQHKEIARQVALIPNKRGRELLRDDLLKQFEKRKAEFNSGLVNAQKIANWTPLDQNAQADWFDASYMFGVAEGFDIVIGNPPYIQLQKNSGKLGKFYKDAGYTTFASTGDIYQLFFEKGCQLLVPRNGFLSYITSNSWLKAEYGKRLRCYFSEQHTPLLLLEMGKDIFENAIVDTSILMVQEGKSGETGKAVDMDRLPEKQFPPDEKVWGQLRPEREKPWAALSAIERSIMDKMEAIGTPLKDWDIDINYGIKTGYNTAFIIDSEMRAELIAQDPKSDEIIKPVLRGRDIQRYQARWAQLWLIDTHNGYGDVPPINIDDYPAVKTHLDKFYERLALRYDKGLTPYNLRNCAYYEQFANEKIVWIELVNRGRFAYDESGIFCEATAFMMTGPCIKYLCAMLNSKLIHWFLQQVAPTSGLGTLRWKKVYIESIPIPKVSAKIQDSLVHPIDEILSAKTANCEAESRKWEGEIDRKVFELFGLSQLEVQSIVPSSG